MHAKKNRGSYEPILGCRLLVRKNIQKKEVTIHPISAWGVNGCPATSLLSASNTDFLFFLTVEIYPRILQNVSAPSTDRNVPEIFC